MTALRQSAIAELERVPEDKLTTIIQFINSIMTETKAEKVGMIWISSLCRLRKEVRMQMLM